jgi:gluconolactonase
MNAKAIVITGLSCLGAMVVLGQAPPPAVPTTPSQGPGAQAPQDARYADFVAKNCKNPPAPRGGGAARGGGAPGAGAAAAGGPGRGDGGGAGRGANAAAGTPMPREYMVSEIPGVIAAGQKWKSIWTGTGNNADGIIATKGGGILAAQNTNSDVLEIDKNGKTSTPYKDTNTGGALSMNKKGALFVVSRGFPTSVRQLAPKNQLIADKYNGEPLDCIGGVINDLTADSKGGVYFTMGGVYYVNPKGEVTKQGTVAGTNGIILSPDEKTLYVTGRVGGGRGAAPAGGAPPAPAGAGADARGGRGGAGGGGGGIVAFDVQPDGSLTNERQFAMVGGDGSTVDAAGRIYSTGGGGVQVIAPDGKFLGEIPTPLGFITVAFSGPDKKTLYGVANNQRYDEIFTIQMIAQGYKGRAK